MSLNRIYTYWETPEGENKPGFIDLCKKSLFQNCSDTFEIYDIAKYNSVHEFRWINHKVDWMKANLIYENGGFWIDADMIVMQDLSPLIELVEEYGFAGIPGFFGAKKGNKLLGDWIRGMKDKLGEKKLNFSELIQPLLTHAGFKEFEPFTREMICPVYHIGTEFWQFFQDKNIDKFITENTYIVTLYNSAFAKDFKDLSADFLLNRPGWLISKMFRKAINK